MSGKQGRRPIQGASSTGSPSGKISRASGSQAASCVGVLGAFAGRELDPRGQTHTAIHRRHHETAIDIQNRVIEDGIAIRCIMLVVAALDRQRHAVAEALEHVIRPRAECKDGLPVP